MNQSDYLKDLQDFEKQQGISRLRTLAAEFCSTLDRLPKLKQEVEAMQQMQGVNFDDLAASLEQRLDKVADLLARLDLLPGEVRNSQELEGLMYGLQNAMMLRTIDRWSSEFDDTFNKVRTRIKQQQIEANGKNISDISMIKVPGGSFIMGYEFGKDGDESNNIFLKYAQQDDSVWVNAHKVNLDSFLIGKYLVTQGLWKAVMGNNPSYNQKNEAPEAHVVLEPAPIYHSYDNHPVECVSWDDVQTFICELNRLTGRAFRLPTEAEWEYSARSRGKKEFWPGTSSFSALKNYAWYADNNSHGMTHPVGLKKPNGLGIYDMGGILMEYCNDWYDSLYYHVSTRRVFGYSNPKGPEEGTVRVIRGHTTNYCRSFQDPKRRSSLVGFRLAENIST